MLDSDAKHLEAFCAFISANAALLRAMREKNWAEFARRYYGEDYAVNRYDTRLKAAYENFSKP